MRTLFIKLLLLSLIVAETHAAYAAVDSTQMAPTTTTKRKLCHPMTIDGVTVSGTDQYFAASWSGVCTNVGTDSQFGVGSSPASVAITGGGSDNAICPSDHPYIVSFDKTWRQEFAFLIPFIWIPVFTGEVATKSVLCCDRPYHLTQMSSSWETPDASGRCASGI